MRLSRNKLELAKRLVELATSSASPPGPPRVVKACYVYIYIALEMSEAVVETAGYPGNGFSSCCISHNSKENILLPPRGNKYE